MKKTLWILAGTLIFGSAAMADNPCPTGKTLDFFTTNFGTLATGCTIDNLDFSDFQYNPGGSNPVAASSIGVGLITTLGNEGFDFNPAIGPISGSNQTTSADIQFEIKGLNGDTIDDLGIFFNGTQIGSGGTGFSETFYTAPPSLGGKQIACNPPSPCDPFQVTNPPPNLTNEVVFATPVSSLYVVKDIGGCNGCTGSGMGQYKISDVGNTFSNTVPEPAYTALLLAGLLGLGWLRKRHQPQG